MTKPYISLVFFGEPIAQGRPRISTRGGKPIAYDPAECKEYKQQLHQQAALIMSSKRKKPLLGAIEIAVRVYRPIPASWSAKKRQAADAGELLPVTKPDLSNYIKGIEDGLNGAVWHDDSQIVGYREPYGKYYSLNPRVEVDVWECGDELSR